MKHVIIVNGNPQAGKDTGIGFMAETLRDQQVPHKSYSSIEPVKLMLQDWVDVSRKTEADRKLLAVIGDALQEHSEFRTHQSLWMIEDFFNTNPRGVFFLHMREPHLIDLVRSGCRDLGIEVIRVLVENNRVPEITTNAADAAIKKMDYEVRLFNNADLDSYAEQCFQLLVHLRLI